LYIFGTVEAYAAKYNEDPAEAVAKATKLGHELAWASPESAVIVDRKTYPGHYAAMQDERAAALQLKIGDRVELEGRVYILANAPNHNVALKPVAA
jgi:predicted lysophospholipase L1 biosynthesis ABC-type transport system permease subunit